MVKQVEIDDAVLAALLPGTVITDEVMAEVAPPPPEPKPEPKPEPPPKPKPKQRAKKSSEIKPLPNPTAEVTAAIGQVNKSVSRIAPGVAAALATLERKIDMVDNSNVVTDVRAEVASIKDYIQSLRGGYTMEVVRGDDDKITRVEIEPK